MANVCKLCCAFDPEVVKAAFASGGTDRDIARQFGVSHTAVGRHRRAHVVAPMAAAARALDRGRSERQKRARQLAAIEQGDSAAIVAALLSVESQVAKLANIEQRLERMASDAEQEGIPAAVAHLASQQLKGIEVASRLGGLGAYARRESDGGPVNMFHLTINVPGQERPLVIDAAVPAVPCEVDEE